MFHTVSEITFEHPILSFTPYQNYIAALDQKLGIHLLDAKRHFTLAGSYFTDELFEKHLEKLHDHPPLSRFSANGDLAVCDLESYQCHVFRFSRFFAYHTTLTWHHHKVTALAYSPDGKLLATGDQAGKLFLFQAEDYHVIDAPPPLEDSIKMIEFSHHGEWLAYVDAQGVVRLYDLWRLAPLGTLNLHVEAKALRFKKHAAALLILTDTGVLYEYSLLTQKQSRLNEEGHDWSFMEICADHKALFFLDTKGKIKIQQTPLASGFETKIEPSGITAFFLQNRYLTIGTQNGTVRTIDRHKYLTESRMNFEVKNYQKVREYFEKNQFLLTVPELAKRIDRGWDEMFNESIQHICDGNVLRAHKLATPFLDNPIKQAEFNFFKENKKYVQQFFRLIKNREIEEAYKLVDACPLLKKTNKYHELEKHWSKAFLSAKKLLTKDEEKYKSACEQLLRPFIWDSSKKEMIDQLLKNIDPFKRLDNAIKHENFKLFFGIAEKNPAIKNTQLYKKVLEFGEKKLSDALEYEQEKDFAGAIDELEAIKGYVPLEEQVEELLLSLKLRKEFLEAVEADDEETLYQLMEHPLNIADHTIWQERKRRINQDFSEAFKLAYQGKPKACLKMLESYQQYACFVSKTAAFMKIAYINEILLSHKQKKEIHWKKSLRNYVERFGIDAYLMRFIQHFQAEKLLEVIQDQANPTGYLTLDYPDTLIAYKKGD